MKKFMKNLLPLLLSFSMAAHGAPQVETKYIKDGAITGPKIAPAAVDLATKTTGILPVANGGTGQSSLSGIGLPDQSGNNGKFLFTDGTSASWATVTAGVSSMLSIGATPNANGATIVGGTQLQLQPANGSFGGVITTGAQTIAGAKTFINTPIVQIIGGGLLFNWDAQASGDATTAHTAGTVIAKTVAVRDTETLIGTESAHPVSIITNNTKALTVGMDQKLYITDPSLAGASNGWFWQLQNQATGEGAWVAVPAASPGGSSGEIQYNNAGAFAGASGLTTNGTNLGIGTTPTGPFSVRFAPGSTNGIYFQAGSNPSDPALAIESDGSSINFQGADVGLTTAVPFRLNQGGGDLFLGNPSSLVKSESKFRVSNTNRVLFEPIDDSVGEKGGIQWGPESPFNDDFSASIVADRTAVPGAPMDIIFKTTPVNSTPPTERMRITSDGKVAIGGVSSPVRDFTIARASGEPTFLWDQQDQSADNKKWQMTMSAGDWYLQALDDALSGTTAIKADRTGSTVNSISFGNSQNFFWDNVNNRLGIGTNAPLLSPIHVKGLNARKIYFEETSSSNANFFSFANTSGTTQETYFGQENSTGTNLFGSGDPYALSIGTVTDRVIAFHTNNATTPRLRISSTDIQASIPLNPRVTATTSLGTSGLRWSTLFTGAVNATGAISADSGSITNAWTANTIFATNSFNAQDAGQTGAQVLANTQTPSGTTVGGALRSGAIQSGRVAVFSQNGVNTGAAYLETGNASGGSSGDINLITGTATGTRGSVNLNGRLINLNSAAGLAVTGDFSPSANNTYNLGAPTGAWNIVYTRLLLGRNGAFAAGSDFNTGFTSSFESGSSNGVANVATATLRSGDMLGGGSGTMGGVVVKSGANSEATNTNSTGNVDIFTGTTNATSGTPSTGSINITTGTPTGTNNSTGNIVLTVGSKTGTGTQGSIKFLKTGVPSVVGDVWTATGTDGTGYWAAPAGGGANTALSNLASVAINQALLPGTDNTLSLGDSTKRWGSSYISGASTWGIPNSEQVVVARGLSRPGGGGSQAGMFTAVSAGYGLPLVLYTDSDATNNDTGYVSLDTGNITSGASTRNTGAVMIKTGNNASTGSFNSGPITLTTGTVVGGTRGKIKLVDGSEGTVGHVWTQTAADGSGAWQAAGGGGANTTLSNLTSPTAINQALIPNGTFNLGGNGSTNEMWNNVYVKNTLRFFLSGGDSMHITGGSTTTLPSGVLANPWFESFRIGTTQPFGMFTVPVNGSQQSQPIHLETGNNTSTGDSGNMKFYTGSVVSGTRGKIIFDTASLDLTAAPIGTDFFPSAANTVNIGSAATPFASLRLGTSFGIATSGIDRLRMHHSASLPIGGTGAALYHINAAETMNVFTGTQSGSGASGDLNLMTGYQTNTSGTNNSGSILIRTGDLTDAGNGGSSGGIVLQTGTELGAGARGKIKLVDGTQGTTGHCWVSSATDGTGGWASCPSSGANTSLSNLASTAVNVDLDPATNNARQLGDTSFQWISSYILRQLSTLSGETMISGQIGGLALGGAGPWGVIVGPTETLNLATYNNATANSTATAAVNITTGNKTAGTGDSGNINLTPGTSSGGARGNVVITGHVMTAGAAPSISACGTSPSVAGNDSAGRVTVGTTSSGCVITFNKAWPTAPVCTVIDETSGGLLSGASATVSTTAITINTGSVSDSDVVSWRCVGY